MQFAWDIHFHVMQFACPKSRSDTRRGLSDVKARATALGPKFCSTSYIVITFRH